MPLWRHISKLRNGERSELEWPRGAKADDWPGLIYAFFEGELSADQVLRTIANYGELEDLELTATTLFFLAQKALLENRMEDARSFFRQALAMGLNHLQVVAITRQELGRIGE